MGERDDMPELVKIDLDADLEVGLDTLRRADVERTTATTIVVATVDGAMTASDRARVLDNGADACLIRPVDADELAAIGRALVRVRGATEPARAEAARNRILSTLGHDLRGPLQAITLGTSLVALNDALSDRDRGALARVQGAARRLERLIEQMLTFAKLRDRALALTRRRIDLVDLWTTLVDEARTRAPQRPIELRAPRTLAGEWDPDRLIQVLDNLFSNALRHGEGPVTITLADDGDAVITVHNHGPHIAAAALARLFDDPFVRAADHKVGLGLYLVHEIVTAHGGRVEVESSPDDGTTFRVRLPRAASSAAPAPSSNP